MQKIPKRPGFKQRKRASNAKGGSKVLLQALRAYALAQSDNPASKPRHAPDAAAGTGLVTSVDSWQLQDAKAEFSTLVRRAIDGRPQVVSKHGKDVVVVLSYDGVLDAIEPRENLLDFFRSSPLVGVDLDLERQHGSLREVEL